MSGLTKISNPKCRPCDEQNGNIQDAEFLAYIVTQYGGPNGPAYYSWELVCEKHRRSFLAYRLVRVDPKTE